MGILDENEEPHLAMAVSDCYFGAGGSLVTIYSVTGKPMMLTAYHYPEELLENEITKEEFYGSLEHRPYYKEKNINALSLFLKNNEEIAGFRDHRLEVISKHLANLDGTVGSKIYQHVMNEVDYELRDYSGRRERKRISPVLGKKKDRLHSGYGNITGGQGLSPGIFRSVSACIWLSALMSRCMVW